MGKPYERVSDCTCKLCLASFDSAKRLTFHAKSAHGMSARDYTVACLYGGKAPECPICGQEPRYVALSFKKYCKAHAREAESAAGSVGGKAKETWNKGETKLTDARVAALALKQSGEGNPFYGKLHTEETRRQISASKTLGGGDLEARIAARNHELELVTPLAEYRSRQKQYLEFRCTACQTVQSKTLQAFERGSRCYVCFPVSKSNWELEVLQFVQSVCPDAVSGDRKAIAPKELDVFVPSKRVAVECHGLYWHSDCSQRDAGFDKRSHLSKFLLAQERSIKLLQLFYDEWRDKREICESLIRHRLGASLHRAGARELALRELAADEQREFFSSSHLSGYVPASFACGLGDRSGRVLAAISVRKPRQANKYVGALEVARFSTAPSFSAPGALQKLVRAVEARARSLGYDKLVTYVDRRVGSGSGYEACGFSRVGDTGVDYFYTDSFLRYDRFKFRAQDGEAENVVASRAGVSRIYGCGSYVYEKAL